MLFNRDFMFIHFPKTAGKSLTRYFLSALGGVRYGRLSKGQFNEVDDLIQPRDDIQLGRGHERIDESLDIYYSKGFSNEQLKAIFVCIRNPYDLAVSTYFYQKKNAPNHLDKKNFQMAAELEFKDYWIEIFNSHPSTNYHAWYQSDESIPIKLIRFESMEQDLFNYSEEYVFLHSKLPHLNSVQRSHYSDYIDEELSEKLYERFEYLFELGNYSKKIIKE